MDERVCSDFKKDVEQKCKGRLDDQECSDSGVASLASSDSSSWGSDITEPTSPHSLASLDSPLESVSHEDHTPIPSPSQDDLKHSWTYLNPHPDLCWRRNSVTWDGEEKMVTHVRKRHSSNPSCTKDLVDSSLLSECHVKRSEMPEPCHCSLIKRENLDWPVYPEFLSGFKWTSRCECRTGKRGRFKQLRITDYFKFQSKSSSKWIGLYRQTQGTKEEGKRSPWTKKELSTDTDDLSWLLRNSSGTNDSLSSKCLQGVGDSRLPSPSPPTDLTLPDLINSLSSESAGDSLATELDLVNIEVEIRDSFLVQNEIKPVSRTLCSPPVQKKGIVCQWQGCEAAVPTKEALLDHIKLKHLNSESADCATSGTFSCQWAGCKVQGRSSKCRNWLERHVLFHVDNKPSCLKPFSCIVDGCGQRFGSQLMLQRHVNSHFTTQAVQNGTSVTKKNGELTPTKNFRKNSKKLKLRKRKAAGSDIDFLDDGTAQKLNFQVVQESDRHETVIVENRSFELIGDCLRLTSEPVCRRKSRKGDEVLINWCPDMAPQEWVSCLSVPKEKLVNLNRVPFVLRQKILSAVKPRFSSVKNARKRPRLDETSLT